VRNRLLEIAVGVFLLAGPAAAADLTVSHATLRVISTAVPAAGYFDLANASSAPATLTGASASVCGMIMLHKSSTEGGMARMADVASVVVPPHGKISFAPGGYHLMCMDPAAALTSAHTAKVTLIIEGGPAVDASFTVTDALGHPH
jgi:copper(I)-binding protein